MDKNIKKKELSSHFSKLKQLQQAQTIVTNTILCTVCGGTGHIAQDCKQKRYTVLAFLYIYISFIQEGNHT